MRQQTRKKACPLSLMMIPFALALFSGRAPGANNLNDNGDFALIASDGFTQTVDGAFFADPGRTIFPNLQANEGKLSHIHSWSMAWYKDSLWIGTSNYDIQAEDPGPQIWRYTPSSPDEAGDWGLSGTWDLMFEPPKVSPIVGLASVIGIHGVSADTPRDFGYRVMATCNAGDKIGRLYVGTFGVPGHILYYHPLLKTFKKTSDEGLFNNLLELFTRRFDLGYRSLACYRGRLWTAPAGRVIDYDTTYHPVVFMNPDPAHGAPWQRMVDVSNPASHPLADPGNIGIFQMEVVGDYLYATVINRESGMELWRGDGRDCPLPWKSDAPCNMIWTKIIDYGGGRPPDALGSPVDNAGSTLGVFGDDLYIGAGDSGVTAFVLAELIRVPSAGTAPDADPSVPHTWELLAGWPRRNYDKPGERLPGLENLECHNVGDMAETPPPFWTLPMTALDDDALADDCLPTTNMGPGVNLDLPDPQWSGLKVGPSAYLWRFAEHQGEVFLGTIDVFAPLVPGEPLAFNLLKSADGVSWSAVTRDGFGDPVNFGARTLLSAPDLGLAVGTVGVSGNPAGGFQGVSGIRTYIGTTAPPGNLVPPVPNGGGNQVIYDWNKAGMVDAVLDASASADPFGGGGISSYEWFAGSLDQLGTRCAGVDANDAFSSDVTPQVEDLASRIGDQTRVEHWFTLRVTDVDGLVNCDQVRITASYDLPPTLELHTHVPYGPPDADGAVAVPIVKMIDFEDDGAESYDVTGWCRDDLSRLVRCELVPVEGLSNLGAFDLPEITLSNVSDTTTQPDLCSGLNECQVSASVRSPVITIPENVTGAAAAAIDVQPDMELIAVDEAGNETRFRWESLTQQILDSGDNDPPVCRNADVYMTAGVDTETEVDPAAGPRPICIDPDGDPINYMDDGVEPLLGTVAFDGTIEYTPDDFTAPGIDALEFLAADPTPQTSTATTLRVNIVDDTIGPEVSVSFPVQDTSYLRLGLKAGCGTPREPDICGSANDTQSGITAVEVSIERISDGRWWNGSGFVQGDPVWLSATGTEGWRLGGFLPLLGGDYRVQARARDTFDNLGVSEPVGFRVSVSLLQQLLSRLLGR